MLRFCYLFLAFSDCFCCCKIKRHTSVVICGVSGVVYRIDILIIIINTALRRCDRMLTIVLNLARVDGADPVD